MIDLAPIAPDYEYYTDIYHGKMKQDAFGSSLVDAVAEVECYVRSNATDAELEACALRIKNAICAVCDVMGNSDLRVTEYTAGEVRESYGSAGYSLTAEAAVRRYLAGTGLLKRGTWL